MQTILKAIGLPVMAWLLGANWQLLGDYAKKHPVQVLGLLVLYETALFVRWFLKEVWKRVESPFLDFCAGRLIFVVQTHFSGYEKDYRQHVFYHCRDFDVKGLSTRGIFPLR